MRSLLIQGRKKGHKLILSMSPYVRAQLVKSPDAPIEAEIHWREPTRRARANRYYWGVVLKMMAKEMGETPEYVHELEKYRHNGRHAGGDAIANATTSGDPIWMATSTATLTIAEFSAYLELVMKDGMEYLGITFPEPNSGEEWR